MLVLLNWFSYISFIVCFEILMVHQDSNGYSEQRVEKDKRYTSPVDRGK